MFGILDCAAEKCAASLRRPTAHGGSGGTLAKEKNLCTGEGTLCIQIVKGQPKTIITGETADCNGKVGEILRKSGNGWEWRGILRSPGSLRRPPACGFNRYGYPFNSAMCKKPLYRQAVLPKRRFSLRHRLKAAALLRRQAALPLRSLPFQGRREVWSVSKRCPLRIISALLSKNGYEPSRTIPPCLP